MDDFKIQSVPDEDAEGKPNVCFKGAVLNTVVTLSSLFALQATYMLF